MKVRKGLSACAVSGRDNRCAPEIVIKICSHFTATWHLNGNINNAFLIGRDRTRALNQLSQKKETKNFYIGFRK